MDDQIDRVDSACPIVGEKDHSAPSVFRPEALSREARRKRQLPLVAVPEICVLDPDGDVVRYLKRTCPYRKSSPGILVMEIAKDWTAKNVSSGSTPRDIGASLLNDK